MTTQVNPCLIGPTQAQEMRDNFKFLKGEELEGLIRGWNRSIVDGAPTVAIISWHPYLVEAYRKDNVHIDECADCQNGYDCEVDYTFSSDQFVDTDEWNELTHDEFLERLYAPLPTPVA